MTVVYVQVATQNMKPTVIKMTAVYVLVETLMILDAAVLNLAHLDVIIPVVLP
jgi:hypothetical protein